MKNRILSYTSINSEQFSNFSLNQQLALYQGQESLSALVEDYIKTREEKARKEGVEAIVKKIVLDVRKEIEAYTNLVTKIVDYTYEITKEEFKQKDFKIVQERTKFCFETGSINILIIIDASFEDELVFSNILNEISKLVLEKDNYVAELLYINKRNAELDDISLDNEYPSTRKRDS